LERIVELFSRTTQFNSTGAHFTVNDLDTLLRTRTGSVFVAHVTDRFGDHGLVGAAVIRQGEIVGLAVSCRVLGLGVEHRFLGHIVETLSGEYERLTARIIPTARNNPVRNIYRDHGFTLHDDGVWCRSLRMEKELLELNSLAKSSSQS
jgi:FkbH-like protein